VTLVLPPLVGLGLAMWRSHSLSAWAREPIAWWPIAMVAIAFDMLPARVPTITLPRLADNGHWLWLPVLVTVSAVLVRNAVSRRGWRQAPWLIALFGFGLNIAVIVANGGLAEAWSALATCSLSQA
jgi:hypothetical protein